VEEGEAKCRKGRRAEEKGVIGHVNTCHHSARAQVRKKAYAAATNSAEAEAIIAADYDAAIADEAIDKSALEAMALVKAVHGTKEAEKDAEFKPRRRRN
jgi:hypothetical protein